MSFRTRIKLCGLSRPQDIETAVDCGADAIGLVFYPPSPRYVDPAAAAALVAGLPPFINVVGLFVNPELNYVRQILDQVPLGMLQFHGDETPQQCANIAAAVTMPFLRAVRIAPTTTPDDLLECERACRQASPHFSALLFDTWAQAYGGSGKVFDWSLVPAELAPRAVLSGGLNARNVTDAVTRLRPFAVDVSSGIESAKGIKDAGRMREFVRAVRQADAGD